MFIYANSNYFPRYKSGKNIFILHWSSAFLSGAAGTGFYISILMIFKSIDINIYTKIAIFIPFVCIYIGSIIIFHFILKIANTYYNIANGEPICRILDQDQKFKLYVSEEQKKIIEITQYCYKNNRKFTMMIYGPPGLGKTQFAYKIASYLDNPVLILHLGSLLKCDNLAVEILRNILAYAKKENATIIIDDGEIGFENRQIATDQSNIIKRAIIYELIHILNKPPVSIIMTTNIDMKQIDSSFSRRFEFSISITKLTTKQQQDILKNVFGSNYSNFSKPLNARRINLEKHELKTLFPNNQCKLYNLYKSNYRSENSSIFSITILIKILHRNFIKQLKQL